MNNLLETNRSITERTLIEANEAYHNGTPIMSDAEYDILWRGHQASRKESPNDSFWKDTILDKVGASPRPASGFAKVVHAVKMESLDNAFAGPNGEVDSVTQWLARLDLGNMADQCRIVLEPKIDGASLRLTYINNKFVRAVTRGNGEIGDDVTANVLAAELVPLTLGDMNEAEFMDPAELLINGEVFMTYGSFAHLNVMQRKAGEEEYSNPRNAAAGILRRKNPAEVRDQGLSFLAHGIAAGQLGDSYSAEVLRLERLGFRFPESKVILADGQTPDGRLGIAWLQALAHQYYPTDGVVLKVDQFKLRAALGSTSRAPKWAIAFKFAQEEVETTLRAITVQVGRSGILAPVAELEPVEVDGSVISRATLHNEDQINRLYLKVGDRVAIRKAAGVIPEIVRSIEGEKAIAETVATLRSVEGRGETMSDEEVRQALVETGRFFRLLDHIGGKCPSCGSTEIEKQEILPAGRAVGKSTSLPKLQVAWRCANTAGCKAQLAGRIEHMASRDCLNLSQMGSELCAEIAFRAGLELDNFEHPFDLFDVPTSWFANLSWTTESGGKMTFGESRATTLKLAMEAAKTLPLRHWIAALGIHTIGKNTSKEITRLVASRGALLQSCTPEYGLFVRMLRTFRETPNAGEYAELKQQYAVSHHLGPVSLQHLVEFVNSSAGAYALSRIPDAARSDNHNPEPSGAPQGGPLAGKTFVVTGTLSEPRNSIHAAIEAAGGIVASTISAKTNVLVAGDKAGSKMAKAAKLGVEVWNEERFRKEVAS